MNLSDLQSRILELLKSNPEGISINDLRLQLALRTEEQQHLDRRVRTLDEYFVIERKRSGRSVLYVLQGERPDPRSRDNIPAPLRARILLEAAGRCAMCGRSTQQHVISLQVDHIVPTGWGGKTQESNLQALCSECNQGKQSYFASFDKNLMRTVMSKPKIHSRIAAILEAIAPNPVESYLIGAIAGQEDWQKRLRELRTIGWQIGVQKRKKGNAVRTSYLLKKKGQPLGENPALLIRKAERTRGNKR